MRKVPFEGLRNIFVVFSFFYQVFGRGQTIPGAETMLTKPVEKQHTDTVVNFLIRIACQVMSH